jgi:hypothetical protein
MNEAFTQVVVALCGPSILGLVGWVWALWVSHNKHKLHVAETYLKSESVNSLRADLKRVQMMVVQIATKLDIRIDIGGE